MMSKHQKNLVPQYPKKGTQRVKEHGKMILRSSTSMANLNKSHWIYGPPESLVIWVWIKRRR